MHDSVDRDAFRRLMGSFASGVTVITATGPDDIVVLGSPVHHARTHLRVEVTDRSAERHLHGINRSIFETRIPSAPNAFNWEIVW